jgi:hypothetical protein
MQIIVSGLEGMKDNLELLKSGYKLLILKVFLLRTFYCNTSTHTHTHTHTHTPYKYLQEEYYIVIKNYLYSP